MQNNLAPIGLSTYARLQHLQKTIEALKKNVLAKQSELYVFSDAPKPGDEEKVAAVRSYLRTIDGFKMIHITERETNGRVANSHGGIRMLLERFGKLIFLAEDIVTAPGYLTFMNQALDKYEDNQRVFSITGYCPPVKIPKNYRSDAYFIRRFSAWGFGIWKNRFDLFRYVAPEEYEQFAADKERVSDFVNAGGTDMMAMLKLEAHGQIDAADVRAMYAQFLSDQYTVYPRESLSNNIGMDATGVHCDRTDYFDATLSRKTTFELPDHFVVDPRIVKANREFWNNRKLNSQRILSRVVNKLKRVSAHLLPKSAQ